jgi:D-cysteine desulfhydrase family pyridoxal phosphate-dependent enzyme
VTPIAIGRLDDMPRASLSHIPTPIDAMPNLSKHIGSGGLYMKRDDCTGLGMGGNKARQLEFYLGQAVAEGADTILITGAVQSNYVRTAAAAARKMGMECHIQLEERVPNTSPLYRHSGNVLLNRMLGATLHSFPQGEDEEGADRQLEEIAADLKARGKKPYVIHLGPGHPPLGALGYVVAAREIVGQINEAGPEFNEIIVASGSGATHAGLLFGLRALGCAIPVKGICVRRTKEQQRPRLISRCQEIAQLLAIDNPVSENDVDINDDVLPPGYGKINDAVLEAITLTAHREGIILDPVYTGRAMAGFLDRARKATNGQNLLFIHTGGQPAIFGYEADLAPMLSDSL